MRRVAVVGTSCSGKSTFAARLAGAMGCRHIELDAVHWGPDRTPNPAGEVRSRLEELI